MSVVVPNSTSKFALDLSFWKISSLFESPFPSLESWKHGDIRKVLSHQRDWLDEVIHGWKYDRSKCFSKHQTMGKIVDVLRRASKMGKLKSLKLIKRYINLVTWHQRNKLNPQTVRTCNLSNMWMWFTLLFQEILHSLHIMIHYSLNLLNFQCIIHAKPIDDPLQVNHIIFAKAWNFSDFMNFWKLNKPFNLIQT